MTLSPVFRSETAVRLLDEHGIWERLGPTLAMQSEAVAAVHADLDHIIDGRFRLDSSEQPAGEHGADRGGGPLDFLQDYFFLTLFLSVFESLGIDPKRLPFYARLDYCIMGTITAADNLFDNQAKSLLPLKTDSGATYSSILQLMCLERLTRRVGDHAEAEGLIPADRFTLVQRRLLDMMAEIGRLEGSEEGGVDEIPTPETMVEKVHRVRGGRLFDLAFVAPLTLEEGAILDRLKAAEAAIHRLGTAFQIVDDLTDFEFDLGRRSHNLLVSQIHHRGSPEEKARLDQLWADGQTVQPGEVEGLFADSARVVLEIARSEARQSFQTLHELGHWFPPELADEVVHAIVGLDGVARIGALTREH